MRDAPNFTVLHRRCPLCGSPLIRNRRGIECGEMHCEYADDSTIDRLTAENAKLRAVVVAAKNYCDHNGHPQEQGCMQDHRAGGPCDCGYMEIRKALHALEGK